MFEHESVQIILGVYMIFAMIVGTVTLVALIVYTIVWPLGKTIVNKLRRRQTLKYEPLQWNPAFETFDRLPTVTRRPDSRYGVTYVEDDTQLLNMPGLEYLANRPITAQHDQPDFMDAVDIMHHQL